MKFTIDRGGTSMMSTVVAGWTVSQDLYMIMIVSDRIY
jgi:hypothetical protein